MGLIVILLLIFLFIPTIILLGMCIIWIGMEMYDDLKDKIKNKKK